MEDVPFDEVKFYRNHSRSKKYKRSRQKSPKYKQKPKTKPKEKDYHIIAKQIREQKRTTWYSKVETHK